MCTADIKGLKNGTGTLTVFTNGKGGILDDLIVNRVADDTLYVVSNASRKETDMAVMADAVVGRSRNRIRIKQINSSILTGILQSSRQGRVSGIPLQ